MKKFTSLLAAIALVAGQAWAGSTNLDQLVLAPGVGQGNSDYAVVVKNASGATAYTVTFGGTPSTAATIDGTQNFNLDDNSGASPTLTFTDETNATVVFEKADNSWLTVTPSSATYGVNLLTGNLKVGNGTPSQTLNGEDTYLEGLLEVAGPVTITDDVTITTTAGTTFLNVLTGCVKVGNGSPTVTLDGEDLYVEGTTELTGATTIVGAITASSTYIGAGNLTLDDGSTDSPILSLKDATDETCLVQKLDAGYTTATTAADDGLQVTTGNLRVGNGVATVTLDGEDFYVEGTVEADGAVRFDGALDVNGAVTLDSTVALSLVNAASGSANPWDFTGTLGIMNGSDDFTLFDINITNANHTGSNTAQVFDVANITGDAECTETVINIGTGWDRGITSGSPIVLASALFSLGAQQTFAESDTTPDVSGGSAWKTHATGVTITDFDAGSGTLTTGQIIIVESGGATVYDVTTSGIVGGSTDITTAAGDVTTFYYDGTDWILVARHDLSDDLN